MTTSMSRDALPIALNRLVEHAVTRLDKKAEQALPEPDAVRYAVEKLSSSLPDKGMPLDALGTHLLDLTSGLSNSSLSSTYYGFVTGGVTPAAQLAEFLVGVYDQNVAAHLPEQSAATNIEDRGLSMLVELLALDRQRWTGRTLTTGATAGNIQGLACGREWIIQSRLGDGGGSVGELGLLGACVKAQIREIKVLSTAPHSSLVKAASVVGIGRSSFTDLRKSYSPAAVGNANSSSPLQDVRFDLARLEEELKVEGRACIVAISCGEVNTGNYATYSHEDVAAVRKLCDAYGAWLHVDGAFGIFTRLLAEAGPEYELISRGGAGVDLADSIAGDLHKFLNVPYDSGFFLCRHPWVQNQVYQNAGAAYLKTDAVDIPSPLNIGAENSRRFRGLAVYSTLVGLGKSGYVDILRRQVIMARAIAKVVSDMPELILLNGGGWHEDGKTSAADYSDISTIVLCCAKDDEINDRLVKSINSQKKIYVSGSRWAVDGTIRPACRIAVSNWQADVDKDLATVVEVLQKAVRDN